MTNQITTEQSEALDAYVAKHGRFWKQKLLLAWQTGADANEYLGHALRQLRNQQGPRWLAKVQA